MNHNHDEPFPKVLDKFATNDLLLIKSQNSKNQAAEKDIYLNIGGLLLAAVLSSFQLLNCFFKSDKFL